MTQTLATCPRASNRAARPGRQSGFTLVEILVVMAIASLLAAVVLPQMQNIGTSIAIANQRKDLRIAIEGLGYRAYASGRPLLLEGKLPRAGAFPVEVPPGWTLEFTRPVRYAVNGVCTGGSFTMVSPDGVREEYAMKAPKCEVVPVGVR